MRLSACVAALAVTALAAPHAAAHVLVEPGEAAAGSHQVIVFQVPHGCDGSPTTAIRVRIPDGTLNVKPQPKPGWELETVIGELDAPVDIGHGNVVSETVREVHWSGGHLLDSHFDEFALRARLSDEPGTTIHFPVVQDCEEGTIRWIEVPETGESGGDYDQPAPGIRLTGEEPGHSHGD